VMQHTDHTLPISNSMEKELARNGIDRRKMTVFPLGITPMKNGGRRAEKVRKALGLKSSEPVIIYFGSLSKLRNLDFLFETMQMVVKTMPSARLLILGGTPSEIESLRKLSILFDLERNVVLHQKVRREEVPYYIQAANVGVSPIPPLPMYLHSYPTKLIETLGAARPIVANKEIIEQRYLVKDSGGGLCVPYRTRAFGRALIELLSEPKRAAKMGASGAKFVNEHNSYGKMTIELEKLYFELLRTQRGR
jgi:glycosyltransferase involved in cell wall biosynthesis